MTSGPFKKEDFLGVDMEVRGESTSRFSPDEKIAQRMADAANVRFGQILSRCPKLYKEFDEHGSGGVKMIGLFLEISEIEEWL